MSNIFKRLQAAAMLSKERGITLEQAEKELDMMCKQEVGIHDRKIFDDHSKGKL